MPSSPILSTALAFQEAYLKEQTSFTPLWGNGGFGFFLGRLVRQRIPAKAILNPLTESKVVVMHSGGLWSTINLVRHLILGHQVHAIHVVREGAPWTPDIGECWKGSRGLGEWKRAGERGLTADLAVLGKHVTASLEYTEIEVPGAFDCPTLTPVIMYLTGLMYGLRVSCGYTHRDIPAWLPNLLCEHAKEFYSQPVRLTSLTMDATPRSLLLDYVESRGRSETLKDIMSCEKPVSDTHCGECWPCYRRYRAFQDAGWMFNFAVPPWDGKQAKKHEARWLHGPGSVKGV